LSDLSDERLRLSQSFDDGATLLAAAARMNLEGIVSKKTNCALSRRHWLRLDQSQDAGGLPSAIRQKFQCH
jgi:hypothetical protein